MNTIAKLFKALLMVGVGGALLSNGYMAMGEVKGQFDTIDKASRNENGILEDMADTAGYELVKKR